MSINLLNPNWVLIDKDPSYRRNYIEGLLELMAEREAELSTVYNILLATDKDGNPAPF
jgi:hypothetical protein